MEVIVAGGELARKVTENLLQSAQLPSGERGLSTLLAGEEGVKTQKKLKRWRGDSKDPVGHQMVPDKAGGARRKV